MASDSFSILTLVLPLAGTLIGSGVTFLSIWWSHKVGSNKDSISRFQEHYITGGIDRTLELVLEWNFVLTGRLAGRTDVRKDWFKIPALEPIIRVTSLIDSTNMFSLLQVIWIGLNFRRKTNQQESENQCFLHTQLIAGFLFEFRQNLMDKSVAYETIHLLKKDTRLANAILKFNDETGHAVKTWLRMKPQQDPGLAFPEGSQHSQA